MDTVLLDPPLVALDKDAPVPYAGRDTTSLFSHPKRPSRNLMLWAQGASLTCCTVIAVHVRLRLIGITGLTSVSVFLPRMHSYSFLTLRGTSQQPGLCLKGSVYLWIHSFTRHCYLQTFTLPWSDCPKKGGKKRVITWAAGEGRNFLRYLNTDTPWAILVPFDMTWKFPGHLPCSLNIHDMLEAEVALIHWSGISLPYLVS